MAIVAGAAVRRAMEVVVKVDALEALRSLIVVDTETGGLDPDTDAILTVGMVALNGEKSLDLAIVDHDGRCTPEAMAVNGIDLDRHIAPGTMSISPKEAAQRIVEFLNEVQAATPDIKRFYFAGHNPAFDLGFVRRIWKLVDADDQAWCNLGIVPVFGPPMPRLFGPHRMVDTHSILWHLYAAGQLPREATTSEGAFKHFGIQVEGRHTALGDAKATLELLRRLVGVEAP